MTFLTRERSKIMDLIAAYTSAIAEHWNFWLVTIVMIVAAVIAGFELKVPNWVTFPFVLGGWAYSTLAFGWDGLGWRLLGTLRALSLLVRPYPAAEMTAGDLTLLPWV